MVKNSIVLLKDKDHYEFLIRELKRAQKRVWISTSDLKDLYYKESGKFYPILYLLDRLIKKGVQIRIIHAKTPGEKFQNEFDNYTNLAKYLERMECPRNHTKNIIVDERIAYVGSANLTGAGLGVKSVDKRNFENGFVVNDIEIIADIVDYFDNIWMGRFCSNCKRKEYCSEYKDLI